MMMPCGANWHTHGSGWCQRAPSYVATGVSCGSELGPSRGGVGAVIPAQAWAGGLAAALLIGALAGLLPALKAARLAPTEALWTL